MSSRAFTPARLSRGPGRVTPFWGLWSRGSVAWEGASAGRMPGRGPAVLAARRAAHPHPAAGVKNADDAELRLLASPPLDVTVHSVQDFPRLGPLAGLLSRLVCQKVQGGRLRGGPGERAGRGARAAAPVLGRSPARARPRGSRGSEDTWGSPVLPGSGPQGRRQSHRRQPPPPIPQLHRPQPLRPWTPFPLPPAWS